MEKKNEEIELRKTATNKHKNVFPPLNSFFARKKNSELPDHPVNSTFLVRSKRDL